MIPVFGVIADDFTGACDVGVQFRKRGLETVVLADAQKLTGFEGEFDVVVLDTESRNVGPEDACRKVRDSLGALRKIGARLVYKKIDSTLRGNLGAELDAIMDETEVKAVIVAPSFPAQSRTTVDGHLLVNNTPLARTEFALNSSNPLEESHIPTLIGRQTGRRIEHIGLPGVRSGIGSLKDEIRRLIEHGSQIIVVDAETEGDLAKIAAASVDLNALPCGSAGLAEHVPGSLVSRPRLLVISGSLNSASLNQIATVEKELDAGVLEPDLSEVLTDDENLDIVVGDLVKKAEEAYAEGRDVVIALARSKDSILELQRRRKELGMSSRQVEEKLAFILSESFRKVVAAHRFAGLILVGGDTSIRMMDALGAKGIRLGGEVLPGIPVGRILGGKHEGMRVITKAGGFGGTYTLAKLMEYMRSAGR